MKRRDALAVSSAGIEVTTLQGDRIDMPSLWSDRTILLAFLRHFG